GGGATDGYLHLGWFQANTLNVATSKDRGATWSTPQRLTGGGAPWIAAGPNGRVYASTLVNGTDGLTTVLYRSEDAGATFGSAIPLYAWSPLNGPLKDLGFHQTAADFSTRPTRGNVYLIYPALQPSRSRPVSVFFKRSTDEGRTWSEPMRLSAPPELGRDAGLPTLAVDDATGEVTVSWLDLRDDPANQLARVYAARSTDGGRTFETAAFTQSFNVAAGGFLGHYNQTAARAGRRLAVFSDGAGHLAVARLNFSPVEEPPRPPRRRATTRR
ncbi:MAG TPA: sialidase family protein, partial [Thermoanaerobaculia bacterium]